MDLDKLRIQLTRHEGSRSFPYTDSVGKLSIGVGRNLTDTGLKLDEINYLLTNDIKETIEFLTTHCQWWSTLDEVRQRAIADLAFDIRGKLLDFTHMIAAIQAKDWTTVSKELLDSTFAHQASIRAHDLAAQLLTGKD